MPQLDDDIYFSKFQCFRLLIFSSSECQISSHDVIQNSLISLLYPFTFFILNNFFRNWARSAKLDLTFRKNSKTFYVLFFNIICLINFFFKKVHVACWEQNNIVFSLFLLFYIKSKRQPIEWKWTKSSLKFLSKFILNSQRWKHVMEREEAAPMIGRLRTYPRDHQVRRKLNFCPLFVLFSLLLFFLVIKQVIYPFA